MLAVAAAVTWHVQPHACFPALLVDVQSVGDRAIGEDRSALILTALQEHAVELVGTLSRLQREQLTTALMDVYNTGHSVYLRCAVLNALTALACEELFVSQQPNPLGSPSITSPRSQTGSVGSLTQHGLLDASHQSTSATFSSNLTQPTIAMWITELYYLLHAAASSSTSHRHLKQSVLSADTLNATALQCLDELHIAMPTLRAQLGQQRSRTHRQQPTSGNSRLGDASARDPQPPTEALRSIMRVQRLFRVAEAVHDSGAYVAAQPASRLYAADVGAKRTLAPPAQGKASTLAVVKSFHDAVSDVLDAIDTVPRPWLPQVLRILSVVWNYEGISSSLTSKLDRAVLGTLQAQRRSRRHNASGSPVVSGLNPEASFVPGSPTTDLLSSTCVLCSAWVHAARCKALAPPSFLSRDVFVTDDGSISIPGGYVLRTGEEGFGLYWDDIAASAATGGGASPDAVGVHSVLRWWVPQTASLLVRVADNASMDPQARSMVLAYVQALPDIDRQECFPFLVQPLASSNATGRHGPQFPQHVMWDTPETLLLRLQCAGNASSVRTLTPMETQRIIQYLRHLRDKCWYLPAVRTVVALAIASLVTSAPESFVAPAALLLATCRSAAVLHTLEAVEVYDALTLHDAGQPAGDNEDPARALFDATTSFAAPPEPAPRNAPSNYAVLLSSVVHHILLNEPPSRIVASLPVLTHAFGYRDGVLPNKAALLDQLAVRVPELPNSWYCGHHVVTCCRVFLVSEIDRHLGTTSPTASTETVQMISTTLMILDVVLRHFSDLAVSQTAAMIQNVLQHLPLDAVGLLLDVSADDVQEVLTVCERPQESKCHDASGAAQVALSIEDAPMAADASWRTRDSTIRIPWKAVWTTAPPTSSGTHNPLTDEGGPEGEPQPLVGGAFEFYHTDPTELFPHIKNGAQTRRRGASHLTTAQNTTTTELNPVATVPVVLLNAAHSTAMFDVFLDVDSCAALNLFAVYRSPSGIRVPVGDEASTVQVPFVHFIRGASCHPQCTTVLEAIRAESMVQTSLTSASALVSLIASTFQLGDAIQTLSNEDNGQVHLRIVPNQHVVIQWDHSDDEPTPLLLRILSTDTTCLVFVEQLLLERISDPDA